MPPCPLPRQVFKAAPCQALIESLRSRGVGLMALFQRLRDQTGYDGSYASLRRYVIHLEGDDVEAFVRLETAPGEGAQVDF